MKSTSHKIDLAQILPVSEVNGPGKRAVIWVQGCPKRCQGCWNPQFLKLGSDWQLTPSELFSYVRENTHRFKSIEGITFSGGEPFAQAEQLAHVAEMFRKENLSVMSYSGYTLDEIRSAGTPLTKLLAELDILVDGEYVGQLQSFRLWRSSSNQLVHFLTNRYESFKHQIDQPSQEIELTLESSSVRLTGFPQQSLLSLLKQ